MKSLEELTITVSDISALLPKVIIKKVETEARAKRVARQLFRINRDLTKTNARSIWVAKRGTVQAQVVSEGQELSSYQEAAYSLVEIVPVKLAVPLKITWEAIHACEFDIINDHLTEAGEAIAQKEDEILWDEILGAVHVSGETATVDGGANTITLSYKPILEVESVYLTSDPDTTFTVNSIDYVDGKIKVTVDASYSGQTVGINYKYTSGRATYTVQSGGVLNYVDVIHARANMKAAKYSPSILVVNPQQEGDLLTDSRFIDASQYGNREPILNGEIGKFAGLKVLVTENIPDGTAVLIDPDHAGYVAIKRELEMLKDEIPEADSIAIYLYEMLGAKIVNTSALVLIVNAGSKYENL